jgi:hypothetical protein
VPLAAASSLASGVLFCSWPAVSLLLLELLPAASSTTCPAKHYIIVYAAAGVPSRTSSAVPLLLHAQETIIYKHAEGCPVATCLADARLWEAEGLAPASCCASRSGGMTARRWFGSVIAKCIDSCIGEPDDSR